MQHETKENILNPPNVITLLRILLVPVFVAILLAPWPTWFPDVHFWFSAQPWIAAAVFAVIAVTDSLDGYLARSRGQETDFGRFLDPLADKILVSSALLALVELHELPSWIALIIIAREFIVSGLRMVAASQGVVVAASKYGKVKAVLQIVAILLFIIKGTLQIQIMGGGFSTAFTIFAWSVMAVAVIMTLLSMVDYFSKSRELFGFGGKGPDV